MYKAGSGDTIYFKRGHTWLGYNKVTKPINLDAYGTGAKPKFNGQNQNQGEWPAIIHIKSHNVTIKNLSMVNSGGRAVFSEGYDHISLDSLETDNSYDQSILLKGGANFSVRNSTINKTSQGYLLHGKAGWSAGIVVQNATNYIIENNRVSRTGGEGINQTNWSSGGIIRNNIVYAARAIGIYIEYATNVDVYNNLVLGTTESDYWRSENVVGSGIAINVEAYHIASGTPVRIENVNVYNNLVTYTLSGISLFNGHNKTTFENFKIFNNILVENNSGFNFSSSANMKNVQIMNNIVIPGSQTLAIGNLIRDGIVFSHNYWNDGSGMPGMGNVYNGTTLTKTTGWRNLNSINAVSPEDFVPLDGGTWVNTGANGTFFNDRKGIQYRENMGAFQ